MRILLSKIIIFFLSMIRWALLIILILTLFGMLIPYLSDLNSYTYLQPAIHWEHSINQFVKNCIPTKIAGVDFSRVITLIVVLIVIDVAKTVSDKIRSAVKRHKAQD